MTCEIATSLGADRDLDGIFGAITQNGEGAIDFTEWDSVSDYRIGVEVAVLK